MVDRKRHPLLTLLLLTLIAGVLRFGWIDKPAIWGDESETWRRISGSYQQLVDELRVAGFMPGNYVITWWIKEGFPVWGEFAEGEPPMDRTFGRRERTVAPNSSKTKWLNFTPTLRLFKNGIDPSPLVLRFLPALCGTLMVPAMYFLASRLVARKTALLAAVFTCFSAYMLNYSRDAKMYMQFWFLATLHVACLLWWLEAYRKRDRAVSSEHIADDMVVDGVHQILSDQHINQIGDAFAASPAENRRVIDSGYPSRLETAVRWMAWITSGLAMIAFNAIGLGILGIEVLIFFATVPMRSAWVGAVFRGAWRLLPVPKINTSRRVVSAETARDAAGAVPPTLAYSEPRPRRPFRFFIPPIFGFLVGCAAVGALWYSYKDFTRFYQRVNPSDAITRVDLGDAGISWVEEYNEGRTVGSYFLYNATAYLMNWEWVRPDQLEDVDPTALKWLRWSSMSLLIAIGAGFVPWRKLIRKKPADTSVLRGKMPITAAFIVASWLLLPAYGFYCASGAWTEDGDSIRAVPPTQWIASWIVPGANNPKAESLAGALGAELSESRRAKGWSSHDWGQLLVVHSSDWTQVRWIVIGVIAGILCLMALDRWHTAREKLRGAGMGLALLALFWVIANFIYLFSPPQEGSVWMPRYLGFVWPAFAIVVCVLIRRLPLAPVRALLIAALVATNLTVFFHRVTKGEPRTDLMGHDYRVARDSDQIRMFTRGDRTRWSGAPGYGAMTSMPAIYYVSRETDQPMSPAGAREFMWRSLDLDPLAGDFANAIRVRLERDQKANEFFFWIARPLDSESDVERELSRRLDPHWTSVENAKSWTIYDHWTWRRIYLLERHHWKRSATTRPSGGST